ncbi:hypothetical protein OnM2_051050 [Erysiphe neolycopersici]|uniref:Uncharacterized protein n=1 Tax=Erysiphe neolycopersici TaxID=212602 RepID=A0A420HSK7_9PEZI|nr:hypothetical protein OnM2_051050 [Erysiphe neolycopersici]
MIVVTIGLIKSLGIPSQQLAERGYYNLTMNVVDSRAAKLTDCCTLTIGVLGIWRTVEAFLEPKVEEEEGLSSCFSESESEQDSSSNEDDFEKNLETSTDKGKNNVSKRSDNISLGLDIFFFGSVTFDHLSPPITEVSIEEKGLTSCRLGLKDRSIAYHNYACSLGLALPQVMSVDVLEEDDQSALLNKPAHDICIGNEEPAKIYGLAGTVFQSTSYPKTRRLEKRVLSFEAQDVINSWFVSTGVKLGSLEPDQAGK